MASGLGKSIDGQEPSPTDAIAQLMRQRIDHYLASRSDPSLYQSVRNMSQFVSDDYGNRFLVELIQNAHDAHDPSRIDGEIKIVLDTSEGNGCLYVANRGAGFAGNNLMAITNIALSSKPINAGIGNKGLGFRSVLQVCDWPEIYSTQGEVRSATFNGYCFRFANINDLREHLDGYPEDIVKEMALNLPCWHIPVPAEPVVNAEPFAMDGFATVVRLPLKSSDALQTVLKELELLMSITTPLQLFLERVERITLDPGTGVPYVLERSVLKTWTLKPSGFSVDSPITVEQLRLGKDEFVAAHWEIDDNLFKEALQSSLDKGEVPESWQAWEGAAQVSVAVPLGAPLEQGRLYCFLPLGPEGKAPFAGYINANFYTKMDRRTVDDSIHLNNIFMQMAAWLSCQLIYFLIKSEWSQAPCAVVSLLCWDEKYLDQLKHSMGEDGQGILNHEFLPVRGRNNTISWASPNEAYAWTASYDACLSPKSICEVGGGRVLVESLTSLQLVALDRLYMQLRGTAFKPPPDVIAGWVERIAGQMHKEKAAPEQWAEFYDEVAFALTGHASKLFGKRFLLSVNGELISSELPATGSSGRNRRAADVYFAPVLTVDADVDDDVSKQSLPLERLPATLRKGFALLSRDVPWLMEDGGHRPGRSFLIAGKLAREYDTRDVLRTLAAETRSSGADRHREQALEWAFRLWSSGRSLSDKETRSAGFNVPTVNGWIDAEAAMFGSGWGVQNGKKLHSLLQVTAEASEDMSRSLAHLLPEHAAWPIRHGAQAEWVRFLTAAGVADCLRPIGGERVSPDLTGNRTYLPSAISREVKGLSKALRLHWQEQLTLDCSRMFVSPTYRAELKPWRIPGQNDSELFPTEVRRDYAVQIALAMRTFGDEHRSFRVVRANTGAAIIEPHSLSTPLQAFLTGAEWLPVTRPGGQLRFVNPSSAWYFGNDEERQPRFLDFVVHQVATAIDSKSLDWLKDRAQLGLFNDERHAARALVAVSEAASSRISDIRDIRLFQGLFQRLWGLASQDATPKAAQYVPVLVGGEIDSVSKTSDAFILAYFDDEPDGLKKQLLEEVGEPIFDFVHGDTIAAWNWINDCAPGKFRRISDEPAEVYIDGVKFDDSTPSRLLVDITGPWIVDFLICVAEHKSSAFVRSTQNTLLKIRRATMALAVASGQQIRIARGEEQVSLPSSLRGALVLSRPPGSILIIQAADGASTLDHLAGAAGQLAVALGSRELAHGLDAALLRIAAAMREKAVDTPDDLMVAAALGVEPEAIRQTRRLASGDLIGMLDLAIPLSACMGVPEITSRLQELAKQDDPNDDELRSSLEALAQKFGITMTALEERMFHLVDLSDLMDEFSLPIAKLNAAILTLSAQYKPVSNEHIHRDIWIRHLRQRQPAVAERLRERAAGTFDRQEELDAYVLARDSILTISPDPVWFTTHDELPEEVMNAHIDMWVDECLPAEILELSLDLTLNVSRTLNGDKLSDFWLKFSPILSAWVRTRSTSTTAEIRQIWCSPEETRGAFMARARASGWLDFRILDDDQIAHWLSLYGGWPAGRAASADFSSWDLSEDSVTSNEERSKAERAEQQRRRTEVEFAGSRMSALSGGYAEIAAAVAATVGQAPALEHVSSSDAALESFDFAKVRGASGASSNQRVPKLPEAGMSDEQKMAVGLIGESWAREWLRRRHHLESVDESIWVSCYRDAVLNSSGGRDDLGYDFIVATKSRTYYYEVKASTGDPLRFEMGPTEIIAAQRYRADREHRYRILYLANVGDPARMIPTLLANPFSTKGAGKFRPVGKGSVVYAFDPKSIPD